MPPPEERINRYLDNPWFCPFCEHPDIEGGEIRAHVDEAVQIVTCLSCDAKWQDVYRLAAVVNMVGEALV